MKMLSSSTINMIQLSCTAAIYRKGRLNYDDRISAVLDQTSEINQVHHLLRSVALDQITVRELVELGFHNSFINEITNQPLVLNCEPLNNARSYWEFLDQLLEQNPFFGRQVAHLTIRVVNSQVMVQRLLSAGITIDVINRLLVYPSGRARTDMRCIEDLKIGLPYGVIETSDQITYNCSKVHYLDHASAWPVVRYGAGMNGTYLADSSESYRGTFYYFEPDSSIMLDARKVLVAPNKITACFELLGYKATKKVISSINNGIGNFRLKSMANNSYDFTIFDQAMYAEEDCLDQPLAIGAHEQGIDLVVLCYMTGSTRMVSEILDVRDRSLSFQSLTRINR